MPPNPGADRTQKDAFLRYVDINGSAAIASVRGESGSADPDPTAWICESHAFAAKVGTRQPIGGGGMEGFSPSGFDPKTDRGDAEPLRIESTTRLATHAATVVPSAVTIDNSP